MIVPKYWAEKSLKQRIKGRQVTIRRFGWSDDSDNDAQQNADQRAAQAMAQIVAGEKILRREPKIPYNGADGVPIREEIIKHCRDSVITRNSYGALCINTPDVLFADVDFAENPGVVYYAIAFVLLALVATVAALYLDSREALSSLLIGGLVLGVMVLVVPLAGVLSALAARILGDSRKRAFKRIARFSEQNPDWHLRVYRTPAGFRILVMHDTFDPVADDTNRFFQALASDPIYVRMCKNQRCFRARLTPKPWRIGIEAHMKPRPGVWPVNPARVADRNKWIAHYERVARNYAACRFEQQLGSHTVNAKATYVKQVHDEYCKARSDFEIA